MRPLCSCNIKTKIQFSSLSLCFRSFLLFCTLFFRSPPTHGNNNNDKRNVSALVYIVLGALAAPHKTLTFPPKTEIFNEKTKSFKKMLKLSHTKSVNFVCTRKTHKKEVGFFLLILVHVLFTHQKFIHTKRHAPCVRFETFD